jgi:TonB family protein
MSQVSAHVDGKKQPVDRRVHVRQPVRSLAYVELGEGNGGIVLNVSEGGIAVQAVMSLMSDELPCVRVQMAHSKKSIEAKGRITWTGGLRKTAGVEFLDLSQEARSLLREWVALEAPSRDLVEEVTGPIEKAELPAPVQSLLNKSTDVSVLSVQLPPSAESRLAELPSELDQDFSPVPEPTARGSSALDSIHVVPAAVALVAPEEPVSVVPGPVVREREASELKTAAVISATDGATSTPLSVNPSPPSPLPRVSASVPPDRFGFKPPRTITNASVLAGTPREPRLKLPAVVAIFAAVSLAAGWFAGHGALRSIFHEPPNDTFGENAAVENSEVAPPTTPDTSNIEVIDQNNRRWLVPMQGPLAASRNLPARAPDNSSSQLQRNEMGSNPTLSVPVHGGASTAGDGEKARPPAVALTSREAETILPTSTDPEPRPATPSPAAAGADTQAGALQSGEVIHRVEPVYPPGALAQNIEGTVTLYAVIDTDGTVKSLKFLDGPPSLIPAALAAVRQWRYSPSLLDGRPIQTERQIKIVFQLSRP